MVRIAGVKLEASSAELPAAEGLMTAASSATTVVPPLWNIRRAAMPATAAKQINKTATLSLCIRVSPRLSP